MRGLLLTCVLCACNQVYGLETTKNDVDAIQRGCPALGSDPTYSRYLTQALIADCSAYELSPSRGRALAACRGPEGRYLFSEVLPDGTLAPAVGLPQAYSDPTMTVAYLGVRLLDDQRIAMMELTAIPGVGATQRTIVYRRGDDGTWRFDETLPFGAVVGEIISTFAADRVLVTKPPGADEWARRDGTWQKVHALTTATLGAPVTGGLSMSADGLRLLFYSTGGVAMYTDRSSVDGPFRTASGPIAALPAAFSEMTGDCERVYISGLQSIFYAERI